MGLAIKNPLNPNAGVVRRVVLNYAIKKNAHAVPLASARQHPEPRKPKGKPRRPFVGARGGGSSKGRPALGSKLQPEG